MTEPSTSQIQHPNNERTPLINNNTSTTTPPPPPLRVNPRKRTLWPWIILVTLVVIANIVVLFLLFEGVGTDTRQHFVDSYDPKSILKHIKVFEHIKAANGGGITLGKGFNTSIDYIYNSIGKDSPCILYKQQFIVPNWELNKTPTFARTKGIRKEFKLGEDFVVLPFGGKSTRIGSTRVLSVHNKECNADHYFGLKGRVAIIPHDPACNLYEFTKSAQEMGAIAVAYYTPKGQTNLLSNYTLLPNDWDKGTELIHIPTLSISYSTMQDLLDDELNSKVSITLDSIQEIATSQNLICHVPGKDLDLEYGNPASVIVIGGHLDSYQVDESLGIESKEINNISGASILLEIVNTIKRSQFKPFNHLYFTWFGSRSFHSYGANHFISNLNKNQPLTFNRTLMFLNLENLDNQVPQVYDGKTLKFPGLRNSSSFLTRIMEEHFKENSLKYELVPINKRSGQDSLAFLDFGIPVGGLTSGEDKLIDDGSDKEDGLNLKTLNNCAESLITNIGALAINEHLRDIMNNY